MMSKKMYLSPNFEKIYPINEKKTLMSYSSEPVVSVEIDRKSFFDYDTEYQEQIAQEVNEIIQHLKSKKISPPTITNNPIFFKDIDFHIKTLWKLNTKTYEGGSGSIELNKIVLNFDNTLDIFIDEDEMPTDPFSILELLYVLGSLSKRKPALLISSGIGDGALFFVELTLKNGELVGYNTYGTNKEGEEVEDIIIDDLPDEYGFVCSKEEMEEFFIKLFQEL